MPAARDFAVTARLATPTAVLMLVLIVVGSVVRTTGSGLSCPDWPLCHGKLIPPFQFNILMEWFHRLLALLTGVGLFATSAWTFAHREVRSQLGGLAALCLALFFSQALLGALTVWRLLDPSIVSGHLAVALLLFAALLTLALVAHHEAAPEPRPLVRTGGLRTGYALASLAVWAQAVLGGMVSGRVVDYFTASGMKNWRSIWLTFAAYAFVLGIVFPWVFKYRHRPEKSFV